MIKIAISGPHGSGKTILINKMKDSFESFNKSVYIVEEVARTINPYFIGLFKGQREIWETQIKNEIKASKSNCDIILYDRTLLDNLLYYMDLLEPTQFDPVFNLFWYYTINWMKTYDYISVLPMNPEFIIDDGFRITDMNKTIEINKLFIKYLKPYQNIDINRFNYKEVIMEILK